MKKALILSLILFTGVPISCDDDNDPQSNIFRIESLGVAVGQFQVENDPHSFQEESFTQRSDTLKSTSLAIKISIEETSKVQLAASFSFIPSTYALPAPPIAESKLSLISIYAEEPIFAEGTEYEAGENLANLFYLSSTYYGPSKPILKYIELIEEWLINDNLCLELVAHLDQPLAQPLMVDVTLANGTVFNLETQKIVVN